MLFSTLRHQLIAVRIPDLRGTWWNVGLDDFIARPENRHRKFPPHRNFVTSHRCEHAYLTRSDAGAGANDHLSLARVLGAFGEILSGLHRHEKLDEACARNLSAFLHDDAV